MMSQAPSLAELRAYALDTASPEVADHVRRYLLLSGDEHALAFVASLAEAKLLVEQVTRTAAQPSLLARTLRVLGIRLDPVHAGEASLQHALAAATMEADDEAHGTDAERIQLTVVEPRWLYILIFDGQGKAYLRYPVALEHAEPATSTPQLTLDHGAMGVLGLASSRPLYPADSPHELAIQAVLQVVHTPANDDDGDIWVAIWERQENDDE